MVVDGHVFITVQSGRIPEAVEPVGALIDGQAGPLTKLVRTRPHGIGRHTEGNGVAAPQTTRSRRVWTVMWIWTSSSRSLGLS